jgi:ribosomal protein S18 acetylase RimI-like enzyme
MNDPVRPSAECGDVALQVADPTAALARELIREYFGDILTRFNGHAPTSDEIGSAMLGDPDDAMVPPTGIFFLALVDHSPAGCAGLRLLEDGDGDGVGEIKRVYVRPSARRRGLGTTLIAALESHARHNGLAALRLDSRHELDEALRLYEHAATEKSNDTTIPASPTCGWRRRFRRQLAMNASRASPRTLSEREKARR